MACRRSCSGFDDYLLTRTPLHHTVVFPRDTVCLSCDRTFGVTQGHMGRLMRGPCPGSDCVPDAGLGDAAHDPRPSQGGSVLRSPCQIGSHRPSPHRMPPLQVYIIGGLVDECVLENLTRDASEQVCPHIPPRVDPPPPLPCRGLMPAFFACSVPDASCWFHLSTASAAIVRTPHYSHPLNLAGRIPIVGNCNGAVANRRARPAARRQSATTCARCQPGLMTVTLTSYPPLATPCP